MPNICPYYALKYFKETEEIVYKSSSFSWIVQTRRFEMYMKHTFYFQTKGGQYSTDSFVKAVTELYKEQPQKRNRAIQMVKDCGKHRKKTYKIQFAITLYFAMQ